MTCAHKETLSVTAVTNYRSQEEADRDPGPMFLTLSSNTDLNQRTHAVDWCTACGSFRWDDEPWIKPWITPTELTDTRPRQVTKHTGDCNVWCQGGRCYEESTMTARELADRVAVLETQMLNVMPLRSWCPSCQAFLVGGEHFQGRLCGTCNALTEGRL